MQNTVGSSTSSTMCEEETEVGVGLIRLMSCPIAHHCFAPTVRRRNHSRPFRQRHCYMLYTIPESARRNHHHQNSLILFKSTMSNSFVEPANERNYQLRVAAADGDLERVKALLKEGADPSVIDGWSLRKSAEHGHVEVVRALIESKRVEANVATDAVCH